MFIVRWGVTLLLLPLMAWALLLYGVVWAIGAVGQRRGWFADRVAEGGELESQPPE